MRQWPGVGPLFTYSLLPALSVALLLFFTAALRGRNARGLAAFCLAVAAWCTALLLAGLPAPALREAGGRLAAVGSFIAAGYLHAAYDVLGERSRGLLALAYAVAIAITGLGAVWPGALYAPRDLSHGPLFWPAMALAIAAATVPLLKLRAAIRTAPAERRQAVRGLILSGVLCYAGGMGNALLLAHGIAVPVGVHLVLASLLVLAHVIRAHEPAGERRLLERSLLYAALAALLSAGFLFGALALGATAAEPLFLPNGLSTFFLLLTAALAFEPLRQVLQEKLGKRLARGAAGAADLARALEGAEARADQAGRLAELGTFASAVAHEVRNPLGVLAANLKLLEKQGADEATVAAMRHEIDRASRFVDELLRYGRPRPLELRMVDLDATIELALSTARQGLGDAAPEARIEKDVPAGTGLVEADQGQLLQLLVILVENALLAVPAGGVVRVSARLAGGEAELAVEDAGPGIPAELLPRLFQPFVTGRRRDGRAGTGLGLAIARGIATRHGGSIEAGCSALGGARFVVRVPVVQPILAAAAPAGRPELA